MISEFLITNNRYYDSLNSENRLFTAWESSKFTLRGASDSPGGQPKTHTTVTSFMQMKLNKPLPPGIDIQVYGGLIGAYSVVQSVQGVSYPNFQTSPGITPTTDQVVGGLAQVVFFGPPAPAYGSDFNLITFEQTNTFSNAAPVAFYRVTFKLQTVTAESIPIDVTFNGAIIAAD